MTRSRLALLLAALTLGLAACGSDDDGGDAGGGGGGQAAASGPAQVFSDTCGSCHTLAAAGTEGQVGPNLDEQGPSKEEVLEAIAEGPGVMPDNLLEGAEADEVAQYVADEAGG
jgi:mono/diheme cytochrome c family protein